MQIVIGLGSNIRPEANLDAAIAHIHALPITNVRLSKRYRSAPLGPKDQPDFINQCLIGDTNDAPLAWLEWLNDIEAALGRTKTRHWGERTIDLDILLYGNQRYVYPTLTIPHPEMGARDFVLVPLAELVPDADIPGVGSVQEAVLTLTSRYIDRTA